MKYFNYILLILSLNSCTGTALQYVTKDAVKLTKKGHTVMIAPDLAKVDFCKNLGRIEGRSKVFVNDYGKRELENDLRNKAVKMGANFISAPIITKSGSWHKTEGYSHAFKCKKVREKN